MIVNLCHTEVEVYKMAEATGSDNMPSDNFKILPENYVKDRKIKLPRTLIYWTFPLLLRAKPKSRQTR